MAVRMRPRVSSPARRRRGIVGEDRARRLLGDDDAPRLAGRLAEAGAANRAAGMLTAPRGATAKRVMDLLIAVPALLIVSPLLLVLMAIIRLDSRGPALFRQVRIGKDGRPFVCYKLRTMRHAPARRDDPIYQRIAARWMEGVPLAGAADEPPRAAGGQWSGGPARRPRRSPAELAIFKLRHDPRLTRVGWVLRKTSLDELPQLLNVIRGEMSIVGPRPPILFEVLRYSDRALARLYVKPGMTGLWQVEGRGRVSFDAMVEMDLDYVRRNSLWTDIALVLRTIPAIVSGRGAS